MRRATGLLCCIFALALGPATAQADFGLVPGYPKVSVLDAVGDPYSLAGGRPDRMVIDMDIEDDAGTVTENPEEMSVSLPPGFAGNPGAVPPCSRRDLEEASCDPESQLGNLILTANGGNTATFELYSVEGAPGEGRTVAAAIGIKLLFTMQIDPEDFGVTIRQRGMLQGLVLEALTIELWGVPADHQTGTAIPRRPFLTLPARCDRGPLSVTVEMRSWQQPDRLVTASGDSGVPLNGCAGLLFQPSLGFDLLTPRVDSPAGAAVRLELPVNDDPDGRGSVPMRSASVALPAGLSISPGALDGLTACSDAALHKGSPEPAACPVSAKVGTAELSGQQLTAPVQGTVYLGQEHPGERFRLFIVAEGMGVSAKFVGVLQVDSGGRITVRLEDLPEVSFGRIELRFEDGPRALLATPLTCGALAATGTFTPHGGFQTVQASDSAGVDRGVDGGACPPRPPFSPSFRAGATGARAGASTGLTLTLRRQDGEQLPDRFSAQLPPGLSATLGSVEPCGDQATAAGACPVASRVGSVVGEVGSGPRPVRLDGGVFLGGPYRGAPFSLSLAFGAKVGPFDLGTNVTRVALRVDRESGRVSIDSDPLPRTIEGIPVRFRTIGIDIDRPGFLRNPTSCESATADVSVRSVTAAISRSSSPFAVRGCDRLRFQPQLKMGFTKKGEIRTGGRPGLRIEIRTRGTGNTNVRGADIALPGYLRLNSASKRQICARQDATEGDCPPISRVGTASGHTPLLDGRLSGPLHIVQPEGSGAPELWGSLEVKGVRLDVRSKLSLRGGIVHTSLVDLPDFPITALALNLKGGRHGLLSLDADPCAPKARRGRATVGFEGQNRAYRIAREPIKGCRRVGGG